MLIVTEGQGIGETEVDNARASSSIAAAVAAKVTAAQRSLVPT